MAGHAEAGLPGCDQGLLKTNVRRTPRPSEPKEQGDGVTSTHLPGQAAEGRGPQEAGGCCGVEQNPNLLPSAKLLDGVGPLHFALTGSW